ncbi:MAG: YwmB family TATA-box binding protein [Bacillota bacterium]
MKKWSFYLVVIGIISFIVLQVGNRTIEADSDQDLLTLVSVLQDEHILVKEWSLYSREVVENRDPDQIIADLKDQFADWSWSESSATSTTSNIHEEIKVVTSQSHTYVMYEVKGQGWNEKTEAFVKREWQDHLLTIFDGQASTFSCIKGEFGDKMDEALPVFMNGLLDAFDAEEIEALEEDNFLSTSAYSPLFSGTISEDHDMNLQLGLRKPDGMGGNTTLVVGTPIITIEY